MLWIFGCLSYELASYQLSTPPDMYLSSPGAKDQYCEKGYVYAEGFTAEEAKLALYRAIQDKEGMALIQVEYKPVLVLNGQYGQEAGRTVWSAAGIVIQWGPC